MSLIACSIDEAFATRNTALAAFFERHERPLPERWGASVGLFDDAGGPVAVALGVEARGLLVVERWLGPDAAAEQLGAELQHRAALASLAGVRLEGDRPLPGFSDRAAPAARLERVVAIHQPNYLPWCGYFAKVKASNVFILLDDVPMPGGSSYVNRTRVAGNAEPQWLSIPTRHSLDEPLSLARIADNSFGRKHVGTLRARYGRTPHFKPLIARLEPLFAAGAERLADFNASLLRSLFELLQLPAAVTRSQHLPTSTTSGDRLVELVKRVGGTRYLSGKGGQNYQSEAAFTAAGIALDVRPHQPVPYPQGAGAFEPGLSVIDPLSWVGPSETSALLTLPPSSTLHAP
jgi:hypothetical protein